jgi:hypothetical protein
MLPTAHLEFTWAALNWLQRKAGLFDEADYRGVALASMAPDLLDKPLAMTVYRHTDAALFWGHNLWLHGLLWLGGWLWTRGRGRTFRRAAPYLLAFSGHLVADRMWGFRESLLYPFGAGYWHPWRHVGGPAAMLDAYRDVIRKTPLLIIFESVGLLLLGWFIRDRKLTRRGRLAGLLRTGRVSDEESP